MALGLNHVMVVWFVPSCYSDFAISAQLYGFDEVRLYPYGYPLHQKVLNSFTPKRVWVGTKKYSFWVGIQAFQGFECRAGGGLGDGSGQ